MSTRSAQMALALKNPRASVAPSFGMSTPVICERKLATGDIITFPKLHITNGCLLDEDNQYVVIQEPLIKDGAPVTYINHLGDYQDVIRTYMFVDVKGYDGVNFSAKIFPSMFFKYKRVFGTEKFIYPVSDILNNLKQYPNVDEGLVALSGKSFQIEFVEVECPSFSDPNKAMKDYILNSKLVCQV